MHVSLVQHDEGEDSLGVHESGGEKAVKHQLLKCITTVNTFAPSNIDFVDTVVVNYSHGCRSFPAGYVFASLPSVAKVKAKAKRFQSDPNEVAPFASLYPVERLTPMIRADAACAL